MNKVKLLIALLLLGAGGAGNVWADRGHGLGHGHGHGHGNVRFGVAIGTYWGAPWHYPSPYYPRYYPQVVVQQQAPPVYIEQPQAPVAPLPPVAAAPTNYWYYCAAARGYYPYVRECPGGWQKVLPQPPN